VRALRGLTGQRPNPGDRIIVLANSGDAGVFNGQQFDVLAADDGDRPDRYRLDVRDDEGAVRTLTVWAAGFRDLEGEKQAKRDGRGSVVAATFAQAITTHKSPGLAVAAGPGRRRVERLLRRRVPRARADAGPDGAAIEAHINGHAAGCTPRSPARPSRS
jgi:hypothetical protein